MIKSFGQKILLLLILVLSFSLMLWASLEESGTMDEKAHIPAGYTYMRYFDARLNPEHPPLIKDLAGLPLVLFADLNFDTGHQSYATEINGQWWAGDVLLYESGNDADMIFRLARIGPMLITLLLIAFTYMWAAQLLGPWWAFLPTSFLAFSPTVLAHGHYVTTDIGAAFGILMATYFFVKFLREPFRKTLVWAGLAFGVAQLMKFSAVLLLPFFVLLAATYALALAFGDANDAASRWKNFFKHGWHFAGSLVLIVVIGYLLVGPVYMAHTINYPPAKQHSDTETILTSFGKGPDPEWEACKPLSGVSLGRRMRCLANLNVWMSDKPILRGYAQYMLGVLMVIQRSSGGNSGYFLGEVSSSGWWYYFPVLLLTKEPLASLALMLFAAGLLAFWFLRSETPRWREFPRCAKRWMLGILSWIKNNPGLFAMLLFTAIYWYSSIRSPLNIGIRHIVPTLPFIYILMFSVLKRWFSESSVTHFYRFIIKTALLALFVALYLTSALRTAPQFLPYFNALAGGTDNGYRFAVDSNYDWGQDLKRLAAWVAQRNSDDDPTNDVSSIAVDYFGAGNPGYYLNRLPEGVRPGLVEGWWSSRGNPKEQGIEWLAVSATFLMGSLGEPVPGYERKAEDEYAWLPDPLAPYDRAGKSIFIYKLQDPQQ